MADYRRILALCCVCVLVATAGCAGAQNDDAPTDPDSPAPDDEPAGADESDETDEQEPQVDPDNPYEQRTLTVSVNQSAADRNMLPSINDSLAYWESNSERYAGYPIEYELRPNASANATDVHLEFRGPIETCGRLSVPNRTFAGCAPLVNEPAHAQGTADVEIVTGYTLRSTNRTLRHELGHTLGLDHDAEPAAIMDTNATRNFFADPIRVHYALSDRSYRHTEEETQIRESIAYIERASDAWLNESVNVTYVDDRAHADVLINVTYDDSDCSYEGSCVRSAENASHLYRDQAEITIVQDDEEVVGWQIAANWLAAYHPPDDLPELFRDPDPGDAFEDWWEDDPRPASA